jgi:hypothetical protein
VNENQPRKWLLRQKRGRFAAKWRDLFLLASDTEIFPGLMHFCGEAAKRHYKGLTIDEISRMV